MHIVQRPRPTYNILTVQLNTLRCGTYVFTIVECGSIVIITTVALLPVKTLYLFVIFIVIVITHSHLILRHNVLIDLLRLLVMLLFVLILVLIVMLLMILRFILLALMLSRLAMFVLLIFQILQLILLLQLQVLSVALVVIVNISTILLRRYEYTEGVLSVHAGMLGRIFLPRLQRSPHLHEGLHQTGRLRARNSNPHFWGSIFKGSPFFPFYLSFFASCTADLLLFLLPLLLFLRQSSTALSLSPPLPISFVHFFKIVYSWTPLASAPAFLPKRKKASLIPGSAGTYLRARNGPSYHLFLM